MLNKTLDYLYAFSSEFKYPHLPKDFLSIIERGRVIIIPIEELIKELGIFKRAASKLPITIVHAPMYPTKVHKEATNNATIFKDN